MYRISSIFFFCTALLTLPHCAKYKPIPLGKPFNHKEKNQVEIAAREFTAAEFKRYFDTSVDCSKVVPLQLFVHNKSDKTLILNAQSLNINLLKVADVKRKLHRNTIGRTVIYGAAGVVLWPLLIPAVVDGVKSHKANKEIDADMEHYAFGSDTRVEIRPGMAVNKIMFAERQSFKHDLQVYLTNDVHRIESHVSFDTSTLQC